MQNTSQEQPPTYTQPAGRKQNRSTTRETRSPYIHQPPGDRPNRCPNKHATPNIPLFCSIYPPHLCTTHHTQIAADTPTPPRHHRTSLHTTPIHPSAAPFRIRQRPMRHFPARTAPADGNSRHRARNRRHTKYNSARHGQHTHTPHTMGLPGVTRERPSPAIAFLLSPCRAAPSVQHFYSAHAFMHLCRSGTWGARRRAQTPTAPPQTRPQRPPAGFPTPTAVSDSGRRASLYLPPFPAGPRRVTQCAH